MTRRGQAWPRLRDRARIPGFFSSEDRKIVADSFGEMSGI